MSYGFGLSRFRSFPDDSYENGGNTVTLNNFIGLLFGEMDPALGCSVDSVSQREAVGRPADLSKVRQSC